MLCYCRAPLRGTLASSLRSPAEGEGNEGIPPPPDRGLQEPRVATREESGVLGFPSRRGLTPRGSLECNPDPIFPSGCEGKLGVVFPGEVLGIYKFQLLLSLPGPERQKRTALPPLFTRPCASALPGPQEPTPATGAVSPPPGPHVELTFTLEAKRADEGALELGKGDHHPN